MVERCGSETTRSMSSSCIRRSATFPSPTNARSGVPSLRPGGTLAACDGDYATTTVALGDFDPLQECIEAVKSAFINDVWLVRRLPTLLRRLRFEVVSSRSYGYLQTTEPEYMLTLVDRGADALESSGRIGRDLCASLKAEARRRADADEFYRFHRIRDLRRPQALSATVPVRPVRRQNLPV